METHIYLMKRIAMLVFIVHSNLKNYKPRKPDSVLCYHLSMLPTLKLERAALKRFYMWHCSTQGLPATYITANCCELLPHIFTVSSSSPLES